MSDKITGWITAIAVVVGVYLIYKVIKESKDFIGDNPLGAVGTDENPGWLTQYYMAQSGNVENTSWWMQAGNQINNMFSWWYEPWNEAQEVNENYIANWVDPFGWFH